MLSQMIHNKYGGKEISVKDKKLVGKWDIENQRTMGNFKMTSTIKRGLEFLGYKKKG